MAWMRRGAAVVVGVLASTLLAGCAPLFAVCAMPDIRPPHITVDASIWLRMHAGGAVHACYAGACDRDDGTSASFEVLVPRNADLATKHDLVVTLTDRTGRTIQAAQVALDVMPGQKGSPCPMPEQWSREILIGRTGTSKWAVQTTGASLFPLRR